MLHRHYSPFSMLYLPVCIVCIGKNTTKYSSRGSTIQNWHCACERVTLVVQPFPQCVLMSCLATSSPDVMLSNQPYPAILM